LRFFKFKLSNDTFVAYMKEPSHREKVSYKLVEPAEDMIHHY